MKSLILLLALSLPMSAAQADPMNAELKRASGAQIALSAFRGKPVVLIYEDNGSRNVNKPFKDELWRLGKERGSDGAQVIGIANLEAYNFFPVRTFALMHVSGLEKKVGIPILIDFEGTMQKSPWHLSASASTVVVLDPHGEVVFEKTGALSRDEITAVCDALERMVGS